MCFDPLEATAFADRFRKSRLAFGGSDASLPALMLGNIFGGGRERLERDNSGLVRQVGELQACLARSEADLASVRNELVLARSRTLPPDHLQIRQVGSVWGDSFFAAGREIFSQLEPLFREADQPLETTKAFLDFGCGCGRILKAFEGFPHAGELWGSDVDAEAIAWNRTNLGHLAQFTSNADLPPMRFPDGWFSAVLAVSVFTHLPEEMQIAWLSELRRIIRPGGVLVASLHGAHYLSDSNPDLRAEVEERGFAYRTGSRTGGLPEYYMVAFHSTDYVRECWGRFFEVVAIKETHVHGVQDAAVLRRRVD